MHDDTGYQDDAYLEIFERYGRQDKDIDPLDDARRISKKTRDERKRALRPFQT
jgi:hypothetical protein